MLEYGDYRLLTQKENIGLLADTEKELLRNLAKRVAQIADVSNYEEKKGLWKEHNSLKKKRPLVLAFPEGSWKELLPYSTLIVKGTFWRSYEWYLRRLIYRAEHIRDDNIIEPVIEVPLVYSCGNWGLEPRQIASTTDTGSWGFDPVLVNTQDSTKLRFPEIEIDEQTTRRNEQAVGEILGDILPIKIYRKIEVDTSLIGNLTKLRGLEQIMVDMIDNPGWLHEILGFMQRGTVHLMDYIEKYIVLDINNKNDYVGSGGLGFTDELPVGTCESKKTCFNNMWGFAESQELDIVSPAMYDEFAVQYQIPLLKHFGLNCYGCCESLNDKFSIVKKIPNLRRVSVSPWTDVHIAAQELEDKYIFSWKPNPSLLIGGFDICMIKRTIRETLEATKGCNVEIILKDTHTVENHPERIEQWIDIAMEMAEEGYR